MMGVVADSQSLDIPNSDALGFDIAAFRSRAQFRAVPLERASDGGPGDGVRVRGYAAVFDSPSEVFEFGQRFVETIRPGAFTRVLAAGPDVRMLLNHNPDQLLARTANGTLRLREDERGLWVDAEVAPTSLGRDVDELIQRGDLTHMSFAFLIGADGRNEWEETPGLSRHTIVEIGRLLDVGPATFASHGEARLVRGYDQPALAAETEDSETVDETAAGGLVARNARGRGLRLRKQAMTTGAGG